MQYAERSVSHSEASSTCPVQFVSWKWKNLHMFFFFNIHKERAQYVVVWICLRLLASFVYMYLFDYFSLSILTNRIWCGGAHSLKVYNHKHHIGRIHQIYFIWFLGAGVVFCVPHQCRRLRRRHYYMGKSIRSHNNLQWLMVLDNWHLIAVGYVQFYL